MKFELVFCDRDDSEKLVIIVMCQNIPVCELRLVSGDNIDIVFFSAIRYINNLLIHIILMN